MEADEEKVKLLIPDTVRMTSEKRGLCAVVDLELSNKKNVSAHNKLDVSTRWNDTRGKRMS